MVHTEVVLRVLTDTGFTINREKSTLVHSLSIQWLGWTWDTGASQLTFHSEKVSSGSKGEGLLEGEVFTRGSLERLVAICTRW